MTAYTAADVAGFAGISADRLRRSLQQRHERDGLPLPYQQRPMLWDRASVDFWRLRNHPLRLGMAPPANDMDAPLQPATDDEQLARFHTAYGQRA